MACSVVSGYRATTCTETTALFSAGANLQITYKEVTIENLALVSLLYKKTGLSEKIISVHQPSSSAEINSQNFKITLESGKKLLLRRCHRLQGQEKYNSLYKMLNILRKEDVRVLEFDPLTEGKVPYFEMVSLEEKICWVFFKYIDAERYYSGKQNELADAAEQIGKMHVCLKKHYSQEMAIPCDAAPADNHVGPFLRRHDWEKYLKTIRTRIERGEADEYDKMFLEGKQVIEEAVDYVERKYNLLEDKEDFQNIHFDLNSLNFLVDKEQKVTIMDFDEVKVGNIYSDIGFAFHRLITTCIEQGEKNILATIQNFVAAYRKGNPQLKFDSEKLVIATYNRALWNIRKNLSLKYDQGSRDWLSSIPVNIKRLKQVKFLVNLLRSPNFS